MIDSQSAKAPSAQERWVSTLEGRLSDASDTSPWTPMEADYDKRVGVSQAMILVAMGGNRLRRNVHP